MTFKVSCEICVLEFSNLEILKLHNIKTHEDAKGLKQCHLCDKKVEKFNALKAHIEKEHTGMDISICTPLNRHTV